MTKTEILLSRILHQDRYPEPGSEAASLLTIDSLDVKELRNPAVFERFKGLLTDSLLSVFSKETAKKRVPRPSSPKLPNVESAFLALGRLLSGRLVFSARSNSLGFSSIPNYMLLSH